MDTLELKVVGIRDETDRIKTLVLERNDGLALPGFEPGAHIDLHLPIGLVRQYSLLNDPAEPGPYVLGVLRELQGRGGSEWVHQQIEPGMVLKAGEPRNNFPLVQARQHLLIAGASVSHRCFQWRLRCIARVRIFNFTIVPAAPRTPLILIGLPPTVGVGI